MFSAITRIRPDWARNPEAAALIEAKISIFVQCSCLGSAISQSG
jgi:hypothetical protein